VMKAEKYDTRQAKRPGSETAEESED